MQQRSCSIGGTRWSRWIGGAWRAGVFALLLTSATGFASPRAPPQGEIGPFSPLFEPGTAPHDGTGVAQSSIAGFSASLFKFKTTLEDDGTDKGGGEQQASTTLKFVDGRHLIPDTWTCDVTVKMPLRTAKYGNVSTEQAAKIAAAVATKASVEVMHSQPDWQPTLFCSAFGTRMNYIFGHDYGGLGGRASAKR